MQYTIVGAEDGSNITVFVSGRAPLVAHSSHPNYDVIVKGVLEGDESVADLFDVAVTAATRFERLTERVTTANGRLYLDGEEVDNSLATQVVRFLKEGVEDWKPLVNFFENVQANPNEHSREQLYNWLAKRDFTITDDGLIVGYKGVTSNLLSIHSGKAIVDGQVVEGQIPNQIGSVIEMPRSEVQHDPAVGCHTGLHVGTYDFAKTFGDGTLLEVHVNPRDVVSVPTECDWAKVRVCRYTVVDTIDAPHREAVIHNFTEDDFDGWGDGEYDEFECPECGDLSDDYGGDICDDCEALHAENYCIDCDDEGCETCRDDDELPLGRAKLDIDLQDDEEVVADLPDESVGVGDVFAQTEKRRAGTTFKVESIEGDYAVGKSLPLNLTRKVRLDRLTSRKYRKV